jgi:uncharacterized repeat protein (TIGR04076 family)
VTKPPNVPQDPEGFELYDLRVEVIGPPDGTIYCGARLGDYFELQGEMLKLPPGQGFSIYSLAALLPLLPAKQRITDPNDWMSTDAEVACPDPNCPTRFLISRTGRRRFTRSQVTATSLAGENPT